MQKHNLNAEFARLAPQFLAFLDKEEKKLRDEMARLKRKSTKDEQGGRLAFLRRQKGGNSAETPSTNQRRPFSAENLLPVGRTMILAPNDEVAAARNSAEIPEYIRILQGLTTDTGISNHNGEADVLGADPRPKSNQQSSSRRQTSVSERISPKDNPLITGSS